MTTQNECENIKNELEDLYSQRNILQMERKTNIDAQIDKLKTVRSSNEYIDDLKKVGVYVETDNTEFEVNFLDLSRNYSKIMSLKNEIVQANMIDNQYDEVISKLTNLNDSIQRLKKFLNRIICR